MHSEGKWSYFSIVGDRIDHIVTAMIELVPMPLPIA